MNIKNYLPNNWLQRPEYNQVKFLPTIDELKKKINEYESSHKIIRDKFLIDQFKRLKKEEELDKMGLTYVSGDKSKFVLTKTEYAWSLKPNISNSHFLYRGEKADYDNCLPTLYRRSEFNYLLENLKRAEFELLIDSHPICKLFREGINLGNDITLVLNNPYGLAQHYSFNTCLIDLTSDFDVAAFFATSKYEEETCSYIPHAKKNSYGVLYVYHINVPFSILSHIDGLSSIGLQPFIRSGLQKGFLWNSHSDFSSNSKSRDLNQCNYITKIYFKHDEVISNRICSIYDSGNEIFPSDELSEKCKEIFETKIFSEAAFNRNLKDNPQDTRENNLKLLYKEGYSVSCERLPLEFSKSDKEKILDKIYNGGWDKLCDSIVMPIDKDGRLMKVLRNIPYDERYKSYFTAE